MKKMFVAVLGMLFFMSMIFVPTSMQTASPYDPWADVNADGKIDIVDIVLVAKAFGTSGNPINHSAFAVPGFLASPAYDSGWVALNTSRERILTHGLNTTDVFVYMMGKYSEFETPYIHQINYGGEILGLGVTTQHGVYWYDLTEMTIRLKRLDQDTNWNYVRIMMWKIDG